MKKGKKKNTVKKYGAPKAKKVRAGGKRVFRSANVFGGAGGGGKRGDEYSLPTVFGTLDCKGDRFGFLTGDGDDVYISGRNLCGARHGDVVRAIVIGTRGDERRREGRVIEIVERNPLNVVATVEFRRNTFVAIPDDKRYGDELDIVGLGGAAEHDKVIIDVIPRENGDRAKVLSVLGRFDEIGMDVKSVIAAHCLRTEFPADVLDEADAIPDVIDGAEAGAPYRRDFRGETVFTIDGSDSKDFDDAISVKRTENGYRLGVYIADVAQYVKEKSPLDREAFARGTSVYLADRVIPMLPEKLSNGLCSLNEGEDRLALCVILELDASGERTSFEICEGVIRSKARLTYTGVQAMLDGDTELRTRYADVFPSLEIMKELAQKRMKRRESRGSIEFELTETQIKFDSVGHVVDIEKRPTLLSMQIIEEFMILANCAVAEKFAKLKIPFVFRVHERPSSEKLQTLNDFLETIGSHARCSLTPTPKQVADLLRAVNPAYSAAVAKVALRSMAKATYEPRNDGHFGLAEEFYCHFTSPIRRYPDLMIHRIIKAYLHGGVQAVKRFGDIAADAAKQSSKTERVAQDCERKVDDYKKAEYLSHRIGEKFTGSVSSVTEFGFFVELDNSAEGLVRLSSLPSAVYDRRRLCIVCGGRKYSIGDRVNITVEKVEGDRVDFLLDA